MKIKQYKYAAQIVKKFNMENSAPAYTPILTNDSREEEPNNFPYRQSVGSILHLTNKGRPDLAFSVGFASRRLENPTKREVANVKRMLRYINQTKEKGITFEPKEIEDFEKLICYLDSDYAGDPVTKKSTISWCSRKQSVIAWSSTEAEFIAAAECCKQAVHLKTLIEELTNKPVKIKLNIVTKFSQLGYNSACPRFV